MNREEAIRLCRYVKACCPQQAIDEYTPDAWADHLEAVSYQDAKAAAKLITAKQPFVQVSELLAEVKKIRAKRIEEHPPLTPPADLDPIETNAWLREARRRVADGEQVTDETRVLKPRHLPDLKALMPRVPAREHPTHDEEHADA